MALIPLQLLSWFSDPSQCLSCPSQWTPIPSWSPFLLISDPSTAPCDLQSSFTLLLHSSLTQLPSYFFHFFVFAFCPSVLSLLPLWVGHLLSLLDDHLDCLSMLSCNFNNSYFSHPASSQSLPSPSSAFFFVHISSFNSVSSSHCSYQFRTMILSSIAPPFLQWSHNLIPAASRFCLSAPTSVSPSPIEALPALLLSLEALPALLLSLFTSVSSFSSKHSCSASFSRSRSKPVCIRSSHQQAQTPDISLSSHYLIIISFNSDNCIIQCSPHSTSSALRQFRQVVISSSSILSKISTSTKQGKDNDNNLDSKFHALPVSVLTVHLSYRFLASACICYSLFFRRVRGLLTCSQASSHNSFSRVYRSLFSSHILISLSFLSTRGCSFFPLCLFPLSSFFFDRSSSFSFVQRLDNALVSPSVLHRKPALSSTRVLFLSLHLFHFVLSVLSFLPFFALSLCDSVSRCLNSRFVSFVHLLSFHCSLGFLFFF